MSCCLLLGPQNKVHSLFWDVSRNYASGVGAVVLISKWVYCEPSREAGVTVAPVPSKHVVGVRIPCLALTTDFRLPPYKGAMAVAVRAHNIALCDFVEDSAI